MHTKGESQEEKEEGLEMTRHDLRSRVLATLGFLLMGAASLGANAADGTIHFTGEIVGAPYEMRVVAKAPAVTHRVVAANTTEVVFLRQWVDRPSARVRVDALGGLPLATAFTDVKGQRSTFDPGGRTARGPRRWHAVDQAARLATGRPHGWRDGDGQLQLNN
jgi:hypothetical protein